jgi:hypothetical protein
MQGSILGKTVKEKMKTVAEALSALAPNRGKRPEADRLLSREDWLDRQKVRGDFSGIQGRCSNLLPLHDPSFSYGDDYNGRRKAARARYNLIWCIGMVVDAERDDGEKQRLIWNNSNWFISMLVFVKRYARKALYWNHGNMRDAALSDFYAMGLEAMGLTGEESLEEIKEAARRFIWRCRQPQSISTPPDVVTPKATANEEIKPRNEKEEASRTGSKPERVLPDEVCRSVLRYVSGDQGRLVLGRLAGYWRRGDVVGVANVFQQLADGKAFAVGSKRGLTRQNRPKVGSLIRSMVMGAVAGMATPLVVAKRLLEVAQTGEI